MKENLKLCEVTLVDGSKYYRIISDLDAIFEYKWEVSIRNIEIITNKFLYDNIQDRTLFHAVFNGPEKTWVIAKDIKSAYDIMIKKGKRNVNDLKSIECVAAVSYIKSHAEIDIELEDMRIG